METLPCPFCGSKNHDYRYGTSDREGTPVSVVCEDCGAEGPYRYIKNIQWLEPKPEAIEAWNSRAKVD